MKDIDIKKNNIWGVVSGISAAAIWGGMYVVSKVILDVIPPFALLTLRLILGGGVLGIVVFIRGGLMFSRSQWISVLYLGIVGYGVSLGMQFVGTKLSTASNGAVITSSTPVFVFGFALWILKERISRKQILALVLSTLGVMIVIDPSSAQLSPELFLGNLILLGAGVSWAYHSVLVRNATRELDTLSVSFGAFFGGLMVCLPLSIPEWVKIDLESISIGIVLGILYLGIISTALAFYLWNKSFELLEAGVASLTFFAQPIVGTILGVLLLDEKITPSFILGGLLVGLGIWLAVSSNYGNVTEELK